MEKAAAFIAALAAALASSAASAPAPRFPPYDCASFVPEVRGKATGFFRVAKRSDGRWWAIDPLGRGIVLMGVDHVRYRGIKCQRTGRSPYLETNMRRYPDRRDWEAFALGSLKKWGFNLLGAGCDPSLEHRGLAHTVSLRIGLSMCGGASDASLWICPYENHPSRAFPNVFDPRFAEICDAAARAKCAPARDDPWLLGYFIDNELAWWGRGAADTGLFDAVMAKDEAHSAKRALRAFLEERGVAGAPSAAVKLDFLRLAAERYFATACAAIRRHDPNHLVLGSRFAGVNGAHDAVWEVAGRHCDLVTFNMYPWADLDRNEVRVGPGALARRAADAIAARHAVAGRPLLVTEWSFPALDSGLPCTTGAGQRFRTQRGRTAATELFARTMLSVPSLVGYDYFMWIDEPPEGISDAFPEDSNYGLVNLAGEAYPEITSMFAALQREAGRLRFAPPPAARKAPADAGPTMGDFMARRKPAGAPGGVSFSRDGAEYRVVTRGGLVLAGKVGGAKALAHVSLKGRELGSFNIMADFAQKGLRWREIDRVADVKFSARGGWGVLTVAGERREEGGGGDFAIALEFAIHPDRPYFACSLAKAVNAGAAPLDLRAFLFRQAAVFAGDRARGGARRVPNLWNGPRRDAWVSAADGTWWGGATGSRLCTMFYYYISGDGTPHPDVRFDLPGDPPPGSPEEAWRLMPGETFDPKGAMWAVFAGGEGGISGWEAAASALEKEACALP